jgi:hypothetical protein
MPLTVEQVQQWRREGACVVSDLLDADLVKSVQVCAADMYRDTANNTEDFGSSESDATFPSMRRENAVLNHVALNSSIISAVSQLLNVSTGDVRLSQCELWSKWGGAYDAKKAGVHHADPPDALFDKSSNRDQRIHIDAFNHYLTFPSAWNSPEAVAMIIYYSDSDVCGGGTAFVPRTGDDDYAYHTSEHTPGAHPFLLTPGGRGDLMWMNAREKVEGTYMDTHPEIAAFRSKLYDREQRTSFKPGTVLFYRLDTWHRGTPVREGKQRLVHNLVFKKCGCDWINSWNTGAARYM